MDSDAQCIWPLSARLGEGPVWLAAEDTLWFVDIKGSRIHSYREATGEQRSYSTPEYSAFIFPRGGGGFICGLKSGLFAFEASTGACEAIVKVDEMHPDNRLNDGCVDAVGRLWFGTMDDNERQPTGSLYCYSGDRLERMDTGYVISNGPATSPDGRVLYFVDTARQCVHAYDVDVRGALSGKRIFVRLEEPGVFPDGPVVDCEGNVWIALFGGWGVRCYSPAGQLLAHVALPVAQCTKIAFGGKDLRTMYVTTASIGLSREELRRQPLAGSLFRLRSEVAGLPTRNFAG